MPIPARLSPLWFMVSPFRPFLASWRSARAPSSDCSSSSCLAIASHCCWHCPIALAASWSPPFSRACCAWPSFEASCWSGFMLFARSSSLAISRWNCSSERPPFLRASSSCLRRSSKLASFSSCLTISPSCSLRAFFSASVVWNDVSWSWSFLSSLAAFWKSPLARSLAKSSAGPELASSLSCCNWRLICSGEPSCFWRSLTASVSLFSSTKTLAFWPGGVLARSSAAFSILASSFSASASLPCSSSLRWVAMRLPSARLCSTTTFRSISSADLARAFCRTHSAGTNSSATARAAGIRGTQARRGGSARTRRRGRAPRGAGSRRPGAPARPGSRAARPGASAPC